MYGALDIGAGNISYQKNDATLTTRSGAELSANDTSRWGLTGKEDLGGGMAAEFKIEQGIGTNPRSGIANDMVFANGTSKGNAFTLDNTVMGDRELWLGLTSGALRVNVGYGVTAMRNLAVQTDAAQSNTYGNQIAHDLGGFRRSGVRVDYTIAGGWLASAGVSGNRQSNATTKPVGEIRNGKGWTAGLQYTQGPINAGYFRDEVTGQNPAETVTDSYGLPYLLPAAVAVANTTTKTDLLAASYDAGVAKLFGQYYAKSAVLNDLTGTDAGAGKINGTSVGVRVPFGKATFFAQSFSAKDKQYVAGANAEDRAWKGQTMGVRYDLSKRTYGYLNTGSLKKDASVGTTGDSTKYTQTALGVVHAF